MQPALSELMEHLQRVEVFYDSIGGLLGYQQKCLQMIIEAQQAEVAEDPCSAASQPDVQYHMPQGLDLASYHTRQAANQAVATGLDALPHLAEIYPLGGDCFCTVCAKSLQVVLNSVLGHCAKGMADGTRQCNLRLFMSFCQSQRNTQRNTVLLMHRSCSRAFSVQHAGAFLHIQRLLCRSRLPTR